MILAMLKENAVYIVCSIGLIVCALWMADLYDNHAAKQVVTMLGFVAVMALKYSLKR